MAEMTESGDSSMSLTRSLLAAGALFLGLGWVAADDKADQQAIRKARQEARQKARAEADAKAKAEEEAKAKADAAAKAKQKSEALTKRKSAPKGDHLPLAKRMDDESNTKLASDKLT